MVYDMSHFLKNNNMKYAHSLIKYLLNTYCFRTVLGAETMINKLVCLQGTHGLVGMTKGYFQHYDSKNITFSLENDFFLDHKNF